MRRHWPRLVSFLFCAVLAAPANTLRAEPAQQDGIRWQQDLETAKMLARQTGRLVLIHFWTPECAPCVTLDKTVFNQPGVAGAIEAKFVPVKLNANENPATAQGFGISRVPTDVIISPDGAVVGKLVSPPTPSGYVAEVTQFASEHSATPGSAFARAAAAAPMPSQINSAYANLAIGAGAAPVAAQPTVQSTVSQNAAVTSPASTARVAVAPLSAENQYVAPPAMSAFQAPVPPVVSPAVSPPSSQPASPAVTSRPVSQAANPYVLSPVASSPAGSTLAPASPAVSQVAQPSQAASVTPVGGAPDPKLLPAGAPPLGFDGYCPVSMRNQWKWVPGDPRWGIVHRGRTYWFAGQAEQQQFWSDPDRYSPALSGMDPVMAIDHQQQVPGKREHSIDYDNLFYMFSSEATLQQFTANPERYAVGVREAMGIPRGRLVR